MSVLLLLVKSSPAAPEVSGENKYDPYLNFGLVPQMPFPVDYTSNTLSTFLAMFQNSAGNK